MQIIDCDIHQPNPTHEEWLEFLDEPYRTEVARYGPRRVNSGLRFEEGGSRWDLQEPINGIRPSEPAFYSTQLFDRYGIQAGLLSGNNGLVAGIPDPDYVEALARALNDYYLERWIPADPRFNLSLRVAQQDPAEAVRVIDRLGDHPRVVSVSVFVTANRIAFGERFYWPLYEAAQRHNLPLHFHPSTTAVIANAASTAAGMATTYLESHVCLPQFYMAQVASMVLNGVFEKFPRLRVGLIEGGISWLPHLLWRMDSEFRGLRQQVPFLKRMPSEYVRSNVRLATQPLEEPDNPKYLGQIFDMVGGDDIVMYASDFPHWDFDEPDRIGRALPGADLDKIMHGNAAEFFNLGDDLTKRTTLHAQDVA